MSVHTPGKAGKALREQVSRKSQGLYSSQAQRASVIDLIEASNHDRLPGLIPIRHFRMSASPFAFYRGTASIMAHDLAALAHTNIMVQAIGDCHLMNFGGFATPERTLIFDVNDFDETLPASWEWDVKRLATSFVLAARHNGIHPIGGKEAAYALVKSYRENIIRFSQMNSLDLWYMKFDIATIQAKARSEEVKEFLAEAIEKTNRTTNQKIFYKITENVVGKFAITDQLPLVYHPFDIHEAAETIRGFMDQYKQTLQADRRWLLDQNEVIDIALKVV